MRAIPHGPRCTAALSVRRPVRSVALSAVPRPGAKIGAASGATASLLHAFFKKPGSNPTYRNFVERCLSDRGYDLAGWN